VVSFLFGFITPLGIALPQLVVIAIPQIDTALGILIMVWAKWLCIAVGLGFLGARLAQPDSRARFGRDGSSWLVGLLVGIIANVVAMFVAFGIAMRG
jgi:hypothetical protein